MDFAIATPMQEPGASATMPPGTLQALQEKLAAAKAFIAKLQAELGAAKAKVKAEKAKTELAVKIASLEAKHEAAAEIGALHMGSPAVARLHR